MPLKEALLPSRPTAAAIIEEFSSQQLITFSLPSPSVACIVFRLEYQEPPANPYALYQAAGTIVSEYSRVKDWQMFSFATPISNLTQEPKPSLTAVVSDPNFPSTKNQLLQPSPPWLHLSPADNYHVLTVAGSNLEDAFDRRSETMKRLANLFEYLMQARGFSDLRRVVRGAKRTVKPNGLEIFQFQLRHPPAVSPRESLASLN